MTTLTEKMAVLEEQLADQNTAIIGYVDTVETKLQSMLDMLDIINTNAAANTKYILAALSQTGACFPCPSPPMIVPPIGTTPGSVNTDRCKRSQAIIAVLHALFENMDTMQSFNVIGTYNVVYGAISDYIGTIAAGDTVPLPSAPEAINIVGDYVSYAGERLFSGVGLVDQFSPLESDLTNAISHTTTPGAAQSAYNAVIEASGVSNGARLLFEATAYTALWSYYFDPSSTPDLSAYDGAVCGIIDCVTIAATIINFDGFPGHTAIDWTPDFSGVSVTPGGYHADADAWCTDNLDGWTITSTLAVTLREQYTSTTIDLAPGVPYTFIATDGISVLNLVDDTPFSVELCPPA